MLRDPKEGTQMCMSEWSQDLTCTQYRDWGFLLSSHFLQMGLLLSPVTYKCLIKVLCLVRRPITMLDCVLLKDNNWALVASLGPEINSQACLCVPQGPRHNTKCCLSIHHFIFLFIFCLDTRKRGCGPTNLRTEPSPASLLTISFPHTPACPGTQYTRSVLDRDVIQHLLALLHQWGHCFSSLKCFQSRLAIRANNKIFLAYSEFQLQECRLILHIVPRPDS
jgi:hypothetical protein